MEQLKQHMWLATVLVMSLPLSLSAAADSNEPNPTLESVQQTLVNRIDTLQRALEGKIAALDRKVALQADVDTLQTDVNTLKTKRSVAILQVVPQAPGNGWHYHNPRYFVMGSTIQGFHHTVAFGTEITQSNPTTHTLPAGSYMFELQQPRPPNDDARCAIPHPFRGYQNIRRAIDDELQSAYEGALIVGFRCRVMRIHSAGGIRKLEAGAAVLKFDGTQGFEVRHKIPDSWITAGRSLSTYYGSVRITKLE